MRLAAATLAAFLTLTAAAMAAPGERAGLKIGAATWGTPECGQPRVVTSTPEGYIAVDGGPAEPGNIAWADPARCAIVINQRFKIHTAAKRCHLIVHEWGHLAGVEHSTNPRSVMYGGDIVAEGRVRRGKRVRWEAAGAFRPCVKLAR